MKTTGRLPVGWVLFILWHATFLVQALAAWQTRPLFSVQPRTLLYTTASCIPMTMNQHRSPLYQRHSRAICTVVVFSADSNNGWDDDGGDTPSRHDKDIMKESPPRTERDLFIPIFSLVAIAGLVGSYAWEMLRLYQRGELYLPF
jgi:hypothetical protein